MHYSSFLTYKINLSKLMFVTQAKYELLHVLFSESEVKTVLSNLTIVSPLPFLKTSR